jgi:hypothetical protein
MRNAGLVITVSCDMCGKSRETQEFKLLRRWAMIAGKDYCAHCKKLVGKKPHNLSTLEIRRCLSTMKGGHHGR